MNELPSEIVERKFVETFDVSDWEVETDTGWVDIEKSNKTIEYDVWRLETEDGRWLECADNHIVFIPTQSKMTKTTPSLVTGSEEVFVKDLQEGDEIIVNSDNKYGFDIAVVKSVVKLDRSEHMYDLTVGGDHTYFTNGILSHNTLVLGNTTINAIKDGKNVLYISFEISEDELGRRMDSAFTGLPITNITSMRNEVKRRISDAYATKNPGRLMIKEYPPSSINANEVESFVHQLRLKRDFIPDILVLDYLGIMKPISSNITNSYEKGKFVSEELRALSAKLNCPILTATQYNRSGYNKESVDLDSMADSMAIAHTADLVVSLTQTDEDRENSHIRFEITKSRLSKKGLKGIMGVDYENLSIVNDLNTSTKEDIDGDDAISDRIEKLRNSKKDKLINNNNDGIS